MKHRYVCRLLCFAAVSFALLIVPAQTLRSQTGLGGFTHIANSSAAVADLNVGATLTGKRALKGISGPNSAVSTEALALSGFPLDSTYFVFGGGAAFAIICGDKVLPGTWKETVSDTGNGKDTQSAGSRRIRLSFSKIFSYTINGSLENLPDGGKSLLFSSEEMFSLCQRILAIVGNQDTRRFEKRFDKNSSCAFLLSEVIPDISISSAAVAQEPGNEQYDDSLARATTKSINDAIEKAAQEGGGTVRLKAGTYVCHSIRLRSNIRLELEPGVVIKAAPTPGFDEAEPALNSLYQGFGHCHVCNSLIWGIGLENVTICGGGMLDGSTLDSWTEHGKGYANKTIGLRDCRNVTIRDITIFRGGHFAVHLTAVDNLVLNALRVDSDRDGLDIICCRNVSVSDCIVNTPQDDAIVLKSNYAMGVFRDVENVSITGCHISGYRCGTMLNGHRLRFTPLEDRYRSGGRIKFGTESNGGYRNVTISGCTFDYCGGLMLQSEDGGILEDVTISGITMRDPLYCPVFIRLGARMRGPEDTPVGSIRRVSISDVFVSGADARTACIITGLPGHYVEDISISNINIRYDGGYPRSASRVRPPEFEKEYPEPWMFGTSPAKAFFIRHARNISITGAVFSYDKPDGRPLYVTQDVENFRN